MKFTLEQIKKAFWKTFYESGELWFPYGDMDNFEDKNYNVEGVFKEFLDYLFCEDCNPNQLHERYNDIKWKNEPDPPKVKK